MSASVLAWVGWLLVHTSICEPS